MEMGREEEDSLWGAGGAAGSGDDTEVMELGKAGAGPRGALCGGRRGSCTW